MLRVLSSMCAYYAFMAFLVKLVQAHLHIRVVYNKAILQCNRMTKRGTFPKRSGAATKRILIKDVILVSIQFLCIGICQELKNR